MVDYADPKVWGPHFWFMMRCIANTYSDHPSREQKQRTIKFYDELRYFLPCEKCVKHYIQVLNKYPVSDYVCCKSCLSNWVETVYDKITNSKDNDKEIEKSKDKDKKKHYRERNECKNCKYRGGYRD